MIIIVSTLQLMLKEHLTKDILKAGFIFKLEVSNVEK
jgi:hypothetical protein